MLEVSILKIRHSGATEARKLLQYIQGCHVYAPENSRCTQDEASHYEDNWESALSKGWTLTEFRKRNNAAMPGDFDPKKAYMRQQNEYLFRANRLVLIVERFSPGDMKALNEWNDEGHRSMKEGFFALATGKVDEFLTACYQAIEHHAHCDELRDREMARNIDNGESLIRTRYPSMNSYDPLRLTVAVGGLHRPEQYCTNPVTVVDLALQTEEGSFSARMDFAWKKDKSFENMVPHMLRYGAELLAQKTGNPVVSVDIKNMETEQLRRMLESQKWGVDHEDSQDESKTDRFLRKFFGW